METKNSLSKKSLSVVIEKPVESFSVDTEVSKLLDVIRRYEKASLRQRILLGRKMGQRTQ